jgi:hypothetical protein
MEDNIDRNKEYIDFYQTDCDLDNDDKNIRYSDDRQIVDEKLEDIVFEIQEQCINYVREHSLFICEFLTTQDIYKCVNRIKF